MTATYCTKCGQLGHLYVHCPHPTKSTQKRLNVMQGRPMDAAPQAHEEPEPEPEQAPTPGERVKRWRADNPDKYRDYMRRYMRRRRGGV